MQIPTLNKYIKSNYGSLSWKQMHLISLCQFVELFKLKFKLYLSVTQTSHQAATGTVENNTYPIIYLIDILYTQVYLRR